MLTQQVGLHYYRYDYHNHSHPHSRYHYYHYGIAVMYIEAQFDGNLESSLGSKLQPVPNQGPQKVGPLLFMSQGQEVVLKFLQATSPQHKRL